MTSSHHSPRTLVLGLGETGLATLSYLLEQRVPVIVADSRAEPPGFAALRARYPQVDARFGPFDIQLLDAVDRVVVSPGLAADIPLLAAARRQEIPVVGDIELFARAVSAPVLAVTGSNGKSTVTTLVAAMLTAADYRVCAGGNLGPPALSLPQGPDIQGYVLELSSFQLESTFSLTSVAATVLNVSADHMDRHPSVAQYAAIKARIFAGTACAVINRDDPIVAPMAVDHPHRITFGLDEPRGSDFGLRLKDGVGWLARGDEPLMRSSELRIKGAHNRANALAALALSEGFGAPLPQALTALESFPGLPHRCEWIAEYDQVAWINDSKATNVGATLAALRGLDGPLILIAGGEGKGADFAPLAAAARGKVKAALLLGKDAQSIASALAPVCDVTIHRRMADAVAAARRLAESGDTVLLSPACASLDMYEDFQARGEDFKNQVLGGMR